MRILIVHTSYKIKGGEDSVVENEMNLLKFAGHSVQILLFSNQHDSLLKLLQLPFNYGSYTKTKKAVANFKPDVVHIHNLHFAGSASVLYAIKKYRVPIVITLHNYRMLCPSGTLFYNGQLFISSLNKMFAFKAILKGVYQKSKIITAWLALVSAINQILKTWDIPDRYIVLGSNAKNIFISSRYRHLEARMVIKPNFCYPPSVQKHVKEDYYLYVGRLSSEKGIDTILKVFSKNGLLLKIVGSGPLEEEIKSFALNYTNIQFLGNKNKDEVYELLAGATAILFSSIWHETFGMVIIEAFACGTPAIASAIGEAGNIVADQVNGLLYEPGNENDLADKVNYYQSLSLNEKEFYCKNALKTFQELYTPERNLMQLTQIYSELIK